jgi:hypothetical protein
MLDGALLIGKNNGAPRFYGDAPGWVGAGLAVGLRLVPPMPVMARHKRLPHRIGLRFLFRR